MFKKTMQYLINNPSLKILSILIAVILWLVVVNYDNPKITKPFQVPVTVANEKDLEKMGKVYAIVGDKGESNTAGFYATIYVTGNRKIVDNLSAADFTATADLNQRERQGEEEKYLVPINIIAKRYESKLSISRKTVNMQITIEDFSTEQSYVVGETTGAPAEGYAIGEVEVSPNLIKISGPQSVVSKVSKIVASVNVDGLTEDFTASVVPILYDEEGKVIESTQLRLSQDKVTMSVQILGTKTVAVKCETTGTPADGYEFTGLEFAPEQIRIKGETAILNNLHTIVIPGDAIDIEGATGDVENSIDLTPYLTAQGVSLVNLEENKIAVKALIERLETKTLEIPVEDLEVLNQAEDDKVTFNSSVITVPVRGRKADLEGLTPEMVKATIDLEGLKPGTHRVEVRITLEEKYVVMGIVSLQVHIAAPEPEDQADNGTGGNDTGGETGGNSTGGGTGGNNTGGNNTGGGTGGNNTGGSSTGGSSTGGGTGGNSTGGGTGGNSTGGNTGGNDTGGETGTGGTDGGEDGTETDRN